MNINKVLKQIKQFSSCINFLACIHTLDCNKDQLKKRKEKKEKRKKVLVICQN